MISWSAKNSISTPIYWKVVQHSARFLWINLHPYFSVRKHLLFTLTLQTIPQHKNMVSDPNHSNDDHRLVPVEFPFFLWWISRLIPIDLNSYHDDYTFYFIRPNFIIPHHRNRQSGMHRLIKIVYSSTFHRTTMSMNRPLLNSSPNEFK